MSDATATAREYFDCWNRRDFTRLRHLLHDQYSYTGGDGRVQKGPEAGLTVAQMWATAFPDGKIDVLGLHSAGVNTVVTEFIGRGTQKGKLMEIAPTGRPVTIPVCNVMELRDGKIFAEREYIDMLHLMQQLGVMPIPAAA